MYTVLVCDDDTAIQNSIKIFLENNGYNVLTASDGEECIGVIDSNEIHCLVLDIMMPRMDGLSAMLKIRERQNFPIMIISSP